MSKIIIHNNAEMLSDYSAVHMVNTVIAKGKVSGKQGQEQYSYVTVFHANKDYIYVVSCSKNKSTFTFKVTRQKPHP